MMQSVGGYVPYGQQAQAQAYANAMQFSRGNAYGTNKAASAQKIDSLSQNTVLPRAGLERGQIESPDVSKGVAAALDSANKRLAPVNMRIERSVHEGTKAVIYKVKDMDSNRIISEFPSEHVQNIIAKLWEVSGLVLDKRL